MNHWDMLQWLFVGGIWFVIGFVLTTCYSSTFSDIKRRWLRISGRLSLLIGWPVWAVVTIAAIAWAILAAVWEEITS